MRTIIISALLTLSACYLPESDATETEQGPAGEPGIDGTQGPAGQSGEQGPAGVPGNVYVGKGRVYVRFGPNVKQDGGPTFSYTEALCDQPSDVLLSGGCYIAQHDVTAGAGPSGTEIGPYNAANESERTAWRCGVLSETATIVQARAVCLIVD